jgi:hypothetical protein
MLTVSEDEARPGGALRAGASGYLLKTIEATRCRRHPPRHAGESVVAPEMTGKLVAAYRQARAPAPRRRRGPRSPANRRLSPRELEILRGIAAAPATRRSRARLASPRPRSRSMCSTSCASSTSQLARAGRGDRDRPRPGLRAAPASERRGAIHPRTSSSNDGPAPCAVAYRSSPPAALRRMPRARPDAYSAPAPNKEEFRMTQEKDRHCRC